VNARGLARPRGTRLALIPQARMRRMCRMRFMSFVLIAMIMRVMAHRDASIL